MRPIRHYTHQQQVGNHIVFLRFYVILFLNP
jgi:hypothetical protein